MKDKKSMIMVIFIGITICLFFCFNTTVFATTGTVITSDLRLRKESTTSSEIVKLLDENQEVEILGEDGDWYKVKAKDDIGFVNKQYVKVKESNNVVENNENNENAENTESETTENNESAQETTKNQSAIVKADGQIRLLPLINGDVINDVKTNQVFKIVNTAGAWSYVENSKMSGWILTSNLQVDEVNATVEDDESEDEEQTEETTQENETEEVTVGPDSIYDEVKTLYVASSSVNVRSGPDTSFGKVDGLKLNDEVSVTGENGEWYVVSISGKKGYIAKSLLSSTKKEVTSRRSTPVRQQNNDNNNEGSSSEEETYYAPAAPSGGAGSDVASYAQQFVGYPYVYGASGPNAFDCSGFAQYVYKQFGYYINRTADAQASNGYYVSKDELQPGDLVFFSTYSSGISHVGIYIGGGQFVHASTSRTGVIISSLNQSYYVSRYVTARRIV